MRYFDMQLSFWVCMIATCMWYSAGLCSFGNVKVGEAKVGEANVFWFFCTVSRAGKAKVHMNIFEKAKIGEQNNLIMGNSLTIIV